MRTTTTRTVAATETAVPFDYTTITFPNGIDTLPDYSYAGYHASNDPLPSKNRAATIFLSSTNDTTDRTSDIQNALTQCKQGGIVELAAGTYYMNGSVTISNSNCTLRGVLAQNAIGDPAVNLTAVGTARDLISVGAYGSNSIKYKQAVYITDPYVPVGKVFYFERQELNTLTSRIKVQSASMSPIALFSTLETF